MIGRLRGLAAVAALSLLLIGPSRALAEDAVGEWVGVLTLPPPTGVSHVGVRLKKAADGSLSGGWNNMDQGGRNLTLADVKSDGQTLSLSVPIRSSHFEGKWDPAKKAWVGTWSAGQVSAPLELARGTIPPQPTVQGLDGDWDGEILANAIKLRVAWHIATTPQDGTYATFDSIDQGANGIPVSGISRDGANVKLELKIAGGAFQGVLSDDGKTITGQWLQGGASLPLTLTRRAAGAVQPTLNHPQTPKPPFPYTSQDVAYDDVAAKVKLAGTLTLPRGKGPFPAVVLIAGSGPNTRDEPLLGHRHFLVLSDYLTRHGIAVLRYDKRGTGSSTGDYGKATSLDFADDADASIAFLKTRPEIDPRHIGLIGHSEGGLIAPMVAARNPEVAFIVMMAGPGVNGLDILLEQGRLISKAYGVDDARLQKASALREQLFDIMRDEKDSAAAAAKARTLLASSGKDMGLPDSAIDGLVQQVNNDWFRFFMTYDPATALRKLRIPVLVLNGSNDLQVPPAQNLPPIRAALAGDPKAEIHELPGLNHLFQTSKTGSPLEYSTIEETIAPSALDLITSWVLKQTH
jgi:pimeloyl-ACP methyl ester carboxylesterase